MSLCPVTAIAAEPLAARRAGSPAPPFARRGRLLPPCAALALGCGMLLAGCGQKGPLYLPDHNPAVVTRAAPAAASQPARSGGSSRSSSSSQSSAPSAPAATSPPK